MMYRVFDQGKKILFSIILQHNKSEGVGLLSECTVHGMCVSSGAHCKTGMLVNVFLCV